MSSSELEMKFDPKTVKHLGLKMYSTLPAAVSEIISNSYDAYAKQVGVWLHHDKLGKPDKIVVLDDGIGLSFEEINSKFLIIGRNRREDTKTESPPFNRPPTGKKGLGKLALFGIAKTITIRTVKNGLLNEFELDFDKLTTSDGVYNPDIVRKDEKTDMPNGTKVSLTKLKRKSAFDARNVADNLSKIFIFDDNFQLCVIDPKGHKIYLDNEHKYKTIKVQFEWDLSKIANFTDYPEIFKSIKGKLFTSVKPITPSSGLRGISLYSRGKLVNAPEYFSESSSSHFYSYLTGWIEVDFIEDLPEDVISTNRQSLVWDFPEIAELREFLKTIVSFVASEWRKKRKEIKNKTIKEETGIDTTTWYETIPEDVKKELEKILAVLVGEDGLDNFQSVIKSIYNIVPAYALLHWRHLNDGLKNDVADYYKNGMFGDAADQAVKIYFQKMKDMSSYTEDGETLVGKCYRSKDFAGTNSPKIRLNNLATETEQNIQVGQAHLSRGIFAGFRNPIAHAPIKKMVPDVFSQMDCLNILSIVSYLMTKLDSASIDSNVP